ncbi:M1 family metallopeptidase [Actinoplanes sp. KI2]|uniref:M1 family metallopeptidase n=1 Tax=Actinoplanes sp. KI2 TaxID=2983315 RepID=UPI0021D57F31|nr:M1 family metallopeptidase [Actinoplanes sp. KI2]MCU7727738.1 M1 family metallopeptidase [Actinoplanes sp. KI2]
MTVLHALSALLLLTPAPGSPSPDQAPPDAVQPLAYDVSLSSDSTGARWDGRERIVLRNPTPATMDRIWLRLWGNGVDGCAATRDVTVSAFEGGVPGTPAVGCTAVPVHLNRSLPPGRTTTLAFSLTIRVPERADRFGRVGPYAFLGNALPVPAIGDDLPPYVSNGESFQTPTSNFLVTLDHPAAVAVPATGTVLTESRHGDRLTTRIAAPLVRDFAWAAGPFGSVTGQTSTGVRLRTWFTGEVTADTARTVQADVQRTLEYGAAQYGAYPYPEMDTVIGGFDGFQGMEYPNFVLTEPADLPAVHETAHQWWYALVGNDEYRHPWMDEALAQYTSEKLLGTPAYCANAPFWFDPGMRVDAGMDYYAIHPDFYPPGVYGDGACMFHELESLIGPDAMRTALRDYLARYRFAIAEPAQLRSAFQAVTTTDLTAFWQRWRNTAD